MVLIVGLFCLGDFVGYEFWCLLGFGMVVVCSFGFLSVLLSVGGFT